MSGRHEIACRDSDGRLRIEIVADALKEAKAAQAEIVRLRSYLVPSTKTTLEITHIQPFCTGVPHADRDDLGDRRPWITFPRCLVEAPWKQQTAASGNRILPS